ncbi:MAG TPA: ribonuclease P protein component [Acidobacteriaceae bacterium]
MIAAASRLRKHADYQRVYAASRKQFSRQISYFFAPQPASGHAAPKPAHAGTSGGLSTPRIGLTVGKAMGKAVDRNRIKRRMREAVRRNLALLTAPVDVILHPRRAVLQLDFAELDREVAQVLRAIQKSANHAPRPASARSASSPQTPPPQAGS